MDFSEIKTIAVVGLSSNPDKASHRVGNYLKEHGFKIIPINPGENEILGEKAFPDLQSIPDEIKVDVVDVFRRSDQVIPIVEQAILKKPQVIWLQEGVSNEEAKQLAENAGIKCVMDKCIKKEHAKL